MQTKFSAKFLKTYDKAPLNIRKKFDNSKSLDKNIIKQQIQKGVDAANNGAVAKPCFLYKFLDFE